MLCLRPIFQGTEIPEYSLTLAIVVDMMFFCLGKSCLIFTMNMCLFQANHSIGVSKEHINVSSPFRSRVSIPIDGDVLNWPVSGQYFSQVEMDMLSLFDCHWLVVGAPGRCFPDGANEHFPWLPLTPRVRISCAPTALLMHHLSLEHSPFLKCGALPKDRGKGKMSNS